MKVLEEGREYLVGSMKGTNDQTITFYQRKKEQVELTMREYHEQEAGESLPHYFFSQLDIDPYEPSGHFSENEKEIELDGTTIDELLKVLIAQYQSYQENVPCKENERAIEKLREIQDLQLERSSNRRSKGLFGSLRNG